MKKYIILFFILLFPSLVYIFLSKTQNNYKYLPYYGEKIPYDTIINGQTFIDTIYHTIPNFILTDQHERSFSLDSIENKIMVVEFFFSNCEGICKQMNVQMNRLALKYDKMDDLVFLSITVDPARDTVEQLNRYAQQYKAEKNKWYFLTGEKTYIYTLAQKYFLVNALENSIDSIPDFIHDEHFILIDKNRKIRGFYDGTNEKEVDRLIDEIKVLKAEEFVTKKKQKTNKSV